MNVWIIDTSKKETDYFKKYIKEYPLNKNIKIKYFNKTVLNMCEEVGSPSLIIIDTTAIQGDLAFMYGCYATIYSQLRYFVDKHSSSIICIASYVNTWAKDFNDDLKNDFKDDCVVHSIQNGANNIRHYLEKIYKEYFND